MAKHYWNIQAKNLKTGQTLKQQDLHNYNTTNEVEAYKLAEQFAKNLSDRTRESWVAQIKWVASTSK